MAERFDISDFAYAHRGLWRVKGPPENSLAAFLAATEHGFGIEFDVRPASDGTPMVFHDQNLDRMTALAGPFNAHSPKVLEGVALKNSSETIISLKTLLNHWPGRTPLLCELKVDGRTDTTDFAAEVSALLSTHAGPAAAMSFSVEAVRALPKTLMRGQLLPPLVAIGAAQHEVNLSNLTETAPDYIAPHVTDAASLYPRSQSQNLPQVTWTVSDERMMQDMIRVTDAQIFENISPSMVKSIFGARL